MIFVDAGAWYALATPSDPDHDSAKLLAASINEPFVTSDYIVDELLTLFLVRRQKSKGIERLHDVLECGGTDLVRVDETDFGDAIRVYEQFKDKEWSFTDCVSYVLIQRLQLKKAFSDDRHFQQFGIVEVMPAGK